MGEGGKEAFVGRERQGRAIWEVDQTHEGVGASLGDLGWILNPGPSPTSITKAIRFAPTKLWVQIRVAQYGWLAHNTD